MRIEKGSRKKSRWLVAVTLVVPAALTVGPAPAHAYSNMVTWNGNGTSTGEGFSFNSEICGIENGAPVDGPYIYWVLTASKATAADIDFDGAGGDSAVSMERKSKGSFHKLQTFSGSFVAPTSVVATHNGPPDKKANLVISHGCPGEEEACGDDPLSGYDSVDGEIVQLDYTTNPDFSVTVSLIPTLTSGGDPVTVTSIFGTLDLGGLFENGCLNFSFYDGSTLFLDLATQYGSLPYTMEYGTVVDAVFGSFPNLVADNGVNPDGSADVEGLDYDLSNLILVFTWTNGSGSTTHTFTEL